jgi:hypothetical protein
VTAEERRAWLGDTTLAEIRERIARTPEVSDEALDPLRRILARPAEPNRKPAPATKAA